MKRSLLILAAFIAFGGISAQAQGPKDKLKKELKKEKEWEANLPKNPFLVKENAAKDDPRPLLSDDNILSVTPAMPLQFTFDKCDDVKSRPLVIKNPTDETIDAFLMFQSNSDVELGDTIFEEYNDWNNRYIINYFEVNGFGYAASGDDPYLIKTNLATGSQITKWCDNGYMGLAYDGNLFWTASGNYLIALDANLNPTGRQINVGYNACVAFDGTNLITLEQSYERPARIKAFDTDGNLVADYGTFFIGGGALTYDPNTGLFWAATEGCFAFSLADGKATLEAVLYYGCAVVGFDTDGLPFMMDYSNSGILRKATKFSTYPKGISLSQSAISLKPGETVTVNVTASVEHGSQEEILTCMSLENVYDPMQYFVRPIEFAYNIEPEFVTTDAQFSAFAGYNVQPQTVWIKNTGCAPIVFDEMPALDGGDYFSMGNLITPQNFEGELLAGDSIGAVIGFYSDDVGNYTDKLIITTENTEPIEISLSATVAELTYSVSDDVVAATVNCGANTATFSNTIANNTTVAMHINPVVNAQVAEFEIYGGYYGGEMSWTIVDAENNVIYSNNTSYQSSKFHKEKTTLPVGNLTLKMHDSYGDGWNTGYVTITINGIVVLDQATFSSGSDANANFSVPNVGLPVATIAAGQTANQLTLPLSAFELGGTTEFFVSFEGINDFFDGFSVETPAGQGELVVGDDIDCGEVVVDHSTSQLFAIAASGGCGTLSLSSVSIDDDSDFIFLYGNDNFVKSISEIEVEAKDTLKLWVIFTPSETGARTGTITITPAEGTPATIQLTGTGVDELVEPDYPVFVYEGEGLGFVVDTFGCSQTSATLKGRIANDGEADLIITEPITVTYQAGTVNNGYFNIFDADANTEGEGYLGWASYKDGDYDIYEILGVGDYKLMVYNYAACDGKIIVKSGSKTLLTVNVADADINCEPDYNFTITDADLAKHTVEPGDTLDVEVTVNPSFFNGLNSGSTTINYPLASNDVEADYVEMPAKFVVTQKPNLVFPEVIDFGEATVGQGAMAELDWEDTGCGNYDVIYKGVLLDNGEPNTNSPFGCEEFLYFAPTTAGTFEDELSVIIQYYYDGTKQVKDTFNVTLKGVGVSSPSIVLPELMTSVTAEEGATMVTATVTVGNSSTTTALKLVDTKMATIILNSGSGSYPGYSSWSVQRFSEDEGWYDLIYKSTRYFTQSNEQKTETISLPAGDYRLYMYNSYSSGYWNGGSVSIVASDGIELLGKTRNTTSNSGYYAYFSVAERNTDVTVAPATATANGTADIVFDIPVKGLAVGSHIFVRAFATNDVNAPQVMIPVEVIIEEYFGYENNKAEVEFTPVHTGVPAYSSVALRNLGTVELGIEGCTIKYGSKFDYHFDNNNNNVAVGDSLKVSLNFHSNEAGTFRDTLYFEIYNPIEDEYVIDTIPIVAVANNTQVIAVSTPNGRYAVAGDTIDINVSFDAPVIAVEDEDLASMPKLLMNTNSFAELDSIAFRNNRDDLYTFTFHYPVVAADNVALFDYKEDSIYLNGHIVVDIADFELDEVKLPAVGTLTRSFPVTIDNRAPQIAGFDLSQDGMNVDLTIKFSEQVTGFDQSGIKLTGATLNSLKTKDNITFTASVTLEPCVDITVGINATVKDLAGNTKKLTAEQTIPAIHSYTTTAVAPTCTEEGYTLMTCSLCKHEEKTDVVAAAGHKPGEPTIEVKVAATETTDGKCDTVVVCTVCGTELSRTEGVIPATGNGGNAIAEESAGALVYAQDGAIVVEVAEADGCEISVIDINGRVVAKANATSTRTVIPMTTAGVYMVNFEQETTKVVLP
ncbi:MAG: T9SS type A sorting domain-containing protein [Salinivirgaceae bacterium]|nr:T9SS type A sorting domain-containing protein [Salinivirgaceae bacterium]